VRGDVKTKVVSGEARLQLEEPIRRLQTLAVEEQSGWFPLHSASRAAVKESDRNPQKIERFLSMTGVHIR
jgi:hypothetical protein